MKWMKEAPHVSILKYLAKFKANSMSASKTKLPKDGGTSCVGRSLEGRPYIYIYIYIWAR